MTESQGRAVKQNGHKREEVFNKKFGDPKAKINYSGASADCAICKSDPVLTSLKNKIGVDYNKVSLKGGKTIQIHLGKIPELTDFDHWTSTLKPSPTRGEQRNNFQRTGQGT